jgi:uncharacterized protein with FMN-binding domain
MGSQRYLVLSVLPCLLAVLALSPACGGQTASGSVPGGKWVERSSREVQDLIRRVGPTKPDWFDSVPMDHPQSLDLSWPKPKKGDKWNPQRNPGQYLITIVYRQPGKWRSSAKLFHHIMETNDRGSDAYEQAMDRLGHVYVRLLADYERGAYWRERAIKETGRANIAQMLDLAECYWNLGSKPMAEQTLGRLDRGSTKLWAEMDELAKAIDVARQESKGGWPWTAMLAAANAYRTCGEYDRALSLYEKLAGLDAKGQRPKEAQRLKTVGQQSMVATKVYDGLDLSRAKDGTYTGTGQGYRGSIQVHVTIRAGEIRDVKVGSHHEDWYFRSLTEVPRQLIEHQGVKGVDAVTGATSTSNGIVNAAGEAIGKALR